MHDPRHGLSHDLAVWRERRRTLRWLAAIGALPLAGCGGGSTDSSTTATSTSTSSSTTSGNASTAATGTSASSCSVIPSETAGPYPGDGTNSNSSGVANVLTQSGVLRAGIRSSFGGASGAASGVTLTVNLRLLNAGASCASLSGYAIYLWHCDALGRYSMYSSGVTAENWLRGVQVTDASGQASFTTIFPGCYSGRWPHIHFEIYPSLSVATSGNNDVKTSQLALPASACNDVYASSGYTGSAANLAAVSLSSDNVFSDGYSLQLASVSGSVAAGYSATLDVAV